jgi:hypothetical protein
MRTASDFEKSQEKSGSEEKDMLEWLFRFEIENSQKLSQEHLLLKGLLYGKFKIL